MSGIFQADATIRSLISLAFDDIRKNDWLLDHILGDFTSNPYLKDKYGVRQVDAAKEWLRNNEVPIVMNLRNDQDKFPLVTINLGTSSEMEDRLTMSDLSTEDMEFLPSVVGKPIPYVVKPFSNSLFSYDSGTGIITISDTIDISTVSAGMIFVDPSTGEGYTILDSAPGGLQLEESLTISAATLGIVPQYQTYKTKIRHSWFKESYKIGIHAHGDPQVLLWLHSIILYGILRYREGLLEANGFSEVRVSSGDMEPNSNFSGPGGEVCFSRVIVLTGIVEQTWISGLHRTLESIALREKDESGDGYHGGIKILSNSNSTLGYDTNWTTVEDNFSEE